MLHRPDGVSRSQPTGECTALYSGEHIGNGIPRRRTKACGGHSGHPFGNRPKLTALRHGMYGVATKITPDATQAGLAASSAARRKRPGVTPAWRANARLKAASER